MLYAPTGVGKSMLSLSIALAIAGGGTLMDWHTPGPRKVLYVDGEMDLHDIAERTLLLLDALEGIDRVAALTNLEVLAFRDQAPESWFVDLAREDSREFLLDKVRHHRPALVILDNFSTLASVEDENAANAMDPVIDLMRYIQRRGAAVMLVHHARKTNLGDGAFRGSSKLGTTPNSIIRLEPPEISTVDGGAAFKIIWEKYRRKRSDDVRPRQVRLENGQWRWEASEKPELQQLAALLRSRQFKTYTEIAKHLGVANSVVTDRRNKMVAAAIMGLDEVNRCLAEARELASLQEVEENDDF